MIFLKNNKKTNPETKRFLKIFLKVFTLTTIIGVIIPHFMLAFNSYIDVKFIESYNILLFSCSMVLIFNYLIESYKLMKK